MTENEIKKAKELLEDCSEFLGGNVTREEDEMLDYICKCLDELEQYRVIGTVEEIENSFKKTINAFDNANPLIKSALDILAEYQAIGTIEEFKALKEKNTPYKPQEYEDRYYACKCDNILLPKWKKYPTKLMPKSEGLPHCMACGQKLDWSE